MNLIILKNNCFLLLVQVNNIGGKAVLSRFGDKPQDESRNQKVDLNAKIVPGSPSSPPSTPPNNNKGIPPRPVRERPKSMMPQRSAVLPKPQQTPTKSTSGSIRRNVPPRRSQTPPDRVEQPTPERREAPMRPPVTKPNESRREAPMRPAVSPIRTPVTKPNESRREAPIRTVISPRRAIPKRPSRAAPTPPTEEDSKPEVLLPEISNITTPDNEPIISPKPLPAIPQRKPSPTRPTSNNISSTSTIIAPEPVEVSVTTSEVIIEQEPIYSEVIIEEEPTYNEVELPDFTILPAPSPPSKEVTMTEDEIDQSLDDILDSYDSGKGYDNNDDIYGVNDLIMDENFDYNYLEEDDKQDEIPLDEYDDYDDDPMAELQEFVQSESDLLVEELGFYTPKGSPAVPVKKSSLPPLPSIPVKKSITPPPIPDKPIVPEKPTTFTPSPVEPISPRKIEQSTKQHKSSFRQSMSFKKKPIKDDKPATINRSSRISKVFRRKQKEDTTSDSVTAALAQPVTWGKSKDAEEILAKLRTEGLM